MPYGEVDAVSHFSLADYMGQTGRSILRIPYFMVFRYGLDNFFVPGTLWYAPAYHLNFALMQIISGDRVLPIYMLNTILCSIIVLISFFVISNLFGFWPAFLSSFMLIFALRPVMIYLWGQWPERISFALTPLVLYCFYRYADYHYKGEKKPIYLYFTFIFLGMNLYMHPVGFFHSVFALVMVAIFFWIRQKKMPMQKKHLFVGVLLLIIVLALIPLQTGNVIASIVKPGARPTKKEAVGDISSLFYWLKPGKSKGVPESYFSYKEMNGGYWSLPFLFFGILVLLLRRKREDLVLLGWLVGLYIVLHLDVIGKGPFVSRSLAQSSYLFYPIIAIGFMAIPSFFKFIGSYRKYLKFALIALFLFFVLNFNAKDVNPLLKDAYGGISRINPSQYDATLWMKDNLPEEADVELIGTFNLAKKRWIQFLAFRHINHINYNEQNISSGYLMLDYTDPLMLGGYEEYKVIAAQMQEYEQQVQENADLIYDREYIKIYELNEWFELPSHEHIIERK